MRNTPKARTKFFYNLLSLFFCVFYVLRFFSFSFLLLVSSISGNMKLQKNGEQVYDKCRRYAVDWNLILQDFDIDSLVPNETWPLQNCDKGWEYNTTHVQSSIVIDVRTNFFLGIFSPPKVSSEINFIISFFLFIFSPASKKHNKKPSLLGIWKHHSFPTRHVGIDASRTNKHPHQHSRSTIWCAIRIFIQLWA